MKTKLEIVGMAKIEKSMDYSYFAKLITKCLRHGNKTSADEVYDNLSIFDGGSNEFNLLPNVEMVVSILEKSAVEFPYIIFGNWIITYDIPYSIWNAIDEQNLIPYYGYGYKITDFRK